MVRYLKFIVLVFGSIGLIVASFFYLQNRKDISIVGDYSDQFEYEYLQSNCPNAINEYYFPCLQDIYNDFAQKVSLTGLSMGMKMAYNVMDDDKDMNKNFSSKELNHLEYTLNYLEINNIAMSNAYKRYHGFSFMYGGYIASLQERYYPKAFEFSENLLIGLQSEKGIKQIKDREIHDDFLKRFEALKVRYYQIKTDVNAYLKKTQKELMSNSKDN